MNCFLSGYVRTIPDSSSARMKPIYRIGFCPHTRNVFWRHFCNGAKLRRALLESRTSHSEKVLCHRTVIRPKRKWMKSSENWNLLRRKLIFRSKDWDLVHQTLSANRSGTILTTPKNTVTYHNALCCEPKILHKHFFFSFFLGHFTLGARDFSSAVSGFCQVFIVTRAFFSRLRPTAEDVLAFGQHRKFPPHARKTSGTQGRAILTPKRNWKQCLCKIWGSQTKSIMVCYGIFWSGQFDMCERLVPVLCSCCSYYTGWLFMSARKRIPFSTSEEWKFNYY